MLVFFFVRNRYTGQAQQTCSSKSHQIAEHLDFRTFHKKENLCVQTLYQFDRLKEYGVHIYGFESMSKHTLSFFSSGPSCSSSSPSIILNPRKSSKTEFPWLSLMFSQLLSLQSFWHNYIIFITPMKGFCLVKRGSSLMSSQTLKFNPFPAAKFWGTDLWVALQGFYLKGREKTSGFSSKAASVLILIQSTSLGNHSCMIQKKGLISLHHFILTRSIILTRWRGGRKRRRTGKGKLSWTGRE